MNGVKTGIGCSMTKKTENTHASIALELTALLSLIGELDRSPQPDYWDDYFLPRWTH